MTQMGDSTTGTPAVTMAIVQASPDNDFIQQAIQVRHESADGRSVRRFKSSLRVLVSLVLAASLASFSLAACETSPSENTAARILPANTQGFMTLALSPSVKQKAALLRLSQHFPDDVQSKEKDKNDKDEVVANLLDEMANEWDLTYEDDLKPWLGGEAAAAFLSPYDEEPTPLPIALLKVKDEEEARETLDKKNIEEKQFRFIGEYLVLVGKEDVDRGADQAFDAIEKVHTGDAPALNDEAKYRDAIDSMHDEHLAMGWFDIPTLIETTEADDADFEMFKDMALDIKKLGTLAFTLYATDSSAVLEAVTEHTSQTKLSVTNADLLRRLPSDTLAAAEMNDVSTYLVTQIEAWEKATKALEEEMSFDDEMVFDGGITDDTATNDAATDTVDDLTASVKEVARTLNGETVVAVGGPSLDEINYGAVAQVKDVAATKAAVERLIEQLDATEGTKVVTGTVTGGTSYTITSEPIEDFGSYEDFSSDYDDFGSYDDFNSESPSTLDLAQFSDTSVSDDPVIALSGDKLIVASSEAYAQKLASSLQTSPKENPVENVGSRLTTVQGFVDLAAWVKLDASDNQDWDDWSDEELTEEELTEEEKRDQEKEQAWLDTLRLFSGHVWTEDGHEHTELRLSFK